MISGAAQADVAILVISARKGEFETGFEKGGQTREHIMLVKTAGVSKLVVVVNKMDESTVEWSEERYKEIKEKITPFIRASGFSPKTDLTFIPVSAFTGANMKERVSKSVCPWHEWVYALCSDIAYILVGCVLQGAVASGIARYNAHGRS
jgi:peptide chain release factor subunit 3